MKTEGPLISVITPVYNSIPFIETAIHSVLSQSYTNWEMLITDDCSSDGTCELVEKFAHNDSRIKLFRLSVNQGPGVARNNSIKNSNGKYIAFLDSDDIWLPNKLERQLVFMEKNDCDFSFTSYIIITEEGSISGKRVRAKSKVLPRHMVLANYVGCSTAMYNTENLGKRLMPKIRKRQDYGLWIELINDTGYALGLREELTQYRIRKNSVSGNKIQVIIYQWKFYREVLSFNRVRALIAILTWGSFNVLGIKNRGY